MFFIVEILLTMFIIFGIFILYSLLIIINSGLCFLINAYFIFQTMQISTTIS